jgi:Cytochrome c oxidase assembly protein CtaG/Cox11
MKRSTNKNINFTSLVVVLLLFFLVDEFAFVLYNISLFQYMCANAFSLFLVDEVPLLNFLISDESYYSFTDNTNSSLFHSLTNFNIINNDLFYFSSLKNENYTSLFENISTYDSSTFHKFYKIKMEATNVKKNVLSFYPLQTYIYTIPGESTLIFYRLENLTSFSMSSLSVYVTSPAEAVSYIKKLQCFCYEELMISPKCIIDLPILFSIDEEILNEDFNEITLNYILLLKDKR